jgi:hypothetical protein
MRYCSEPRLYKARDPQIHPEGGPLNYARCRGHRIEREFPLYLTPVGRVTPRRAPRAVPLTPEGRAARYLAQNRGRGLTVAQARQIRRTLPPEEN